jgi:MFS family permease
MGYVLAYGIHCWELFTFRSWMVGFLAASAALAAVPPSSVIAPANIATVSGLVAMATSIGGNELCARFGRRRTIAWVMAGSAAAALTIGFAVELPYGVVAALVLVYAGVIQLDSGALTAGAVGAADPARRGAAMAIHALIGFCVAGVGPLAFGAVLDAAGPESPATAWGLAFAAVGSLGLLGPLALRVGSRTVGVG